MKGRNVVLDLQPGKQGQRRHHPQGDAKGWAGDKVAGTNGAIVPRVARALIKRSVEKIWNLMATTWRASKGTGSFKVTAPRNHRASQAQWAKVVLLLGRLTQEPRSPRPSLCRGH